MDVTRSAKQQAIQHPLAHCWALLEAAELMARKPAVLCIPARNVAKHLAGEAGSRAAETAVMTHGGMGYAQEHHVERDLRESLNPRIAPVSRELIRSFIAERVPGQAKSS